MGGINLGLKWKSLPVILLLAVLVLYLGFPIAIAILGKEVSFRPDIFLTEYAKFLGVLTVALLSFLTIQMYWEFKKKEIERISMFSEITHKLIGMKYSIAEVFIREDKANVNKGNDLIHFYGQIDSIQRNSEDILVDLRGISLKLGSEVIRKAYHTYENQIFPSLAYILKEAISLNDRHLLLGVHREEVDLLLSNLDDLVANIKE